MPEPIWINEQLVRTIHSLQIAEHGGEDGIRDKGLLDSALARPRNVFAYERETADLPRLAAAYLFGIVRNHPFIDGNKRTGLVVSGVFLRLNGWRIETPLLDLYATVMAAATGELDEIEVAKWLRHRVRST